MKGLRSLSSEAHVSHSGFIVAQIKPETLPEMGSDVLTKRAEKVGRVFDIIGPTKNPFILIRPNKKTLKKLIGTVTPNAITDAKVSNDVNVAPQPAGAVKLKEKLFVVIPHAGNRKSKGSRSRKGSRKGNRKRGNS